MLRWVLVSLYVVVVLLVALIIVTPNGCGIASTPIQVVGVVVDAETGLPIEGANILVLPRLGFAEDELALSELRGQIDDWNSMGEDYSVAAPPNPYAGVGVTDGQGRFDVMINAMYCSASGGLFDKPDPPAFYRARLVMVELKGYQRTFFPTAAGAWRVLARTAHNGAYAVADAQTLTLRRSE